MPAALMNHDEDPRKELLDKVGDLSGVEVYGNDILVAVYMRPEKTKSGIILTDRARGEDAFQGKCGLILKLGPTAFVDENGEKFRDIKENDWCVFRPSDGWPVTLATNASVSSKDTILCRVISDINIRMTVASPDLVY